MLFSDQFKLVLTNAEEDCPPTQNTIAIKGDTKNETKWAYVSKR